MSDRFERAVLTKLAALLDEAKHDLAAVRASVKTEPEKVPLAKQIGDRIAAGETLAPLPADRASGAYANVGGYLDHSISLCKSVLSGKPAFRLGE